MKDLIPHSIDITDNGIDEIYQWDDELCPWEILEQVLEEESYGEWYYAKAA